MEVAKDTGKQEKRRIVIRGTGSGVGGAVVWGGVAVLAVGFLVASVSAFKSWRNKENTEGKPDDLNKTNGEADTTSMEYDSQSLETMGKMREDKVDQVNEALNKDEVNNAEEAIDGMAQRHQLAKDQFNNENIKVEQEVILAVQKLAYFQSDREQVHEFLEDFVKKDEELAEEIDLYTPMSHGNEEESDENSSIAADVEEFPENDSYLQNTEKQLEEHERVVETSPQFNQFVDEGKFEFKEKDFVHNEEEKEHEGKVMLEKEEEPSETNKQEDDDGIVKRDERVVETSPMLNRFANEGKFEVTEKDFAHEEEEKEDDMKVMVKKEEESSETNEDDDEEESEENSEGTGDSSIESNVDAIWPAEAVEDILTEIKQTKVDNEISEAKTDDYIKVENKEKSLENDTNNATHRSEIEVSGESVFISRKSNMKELLLNLSNTRTLIWAILVLVLALAAPLVLSPKGIMKLSLVTFFVVSVSRVLKMII